MWLGLVGIGGLLAFVSVLMYIFNVVHAVFFGEKNTGRAMTPWATPRTLVTTSPTTGPAHGGDLVATGTGEAAKRTPGTMVLVILLLASFAIYYFANWKALSDVWPVR
jgi:cytochrome c oxidase subunit 1